MTTGGGGGTPGGANTQVQYNNAGSFGGAAGFTFNGTSTISLGVAGSSVGAIGFRNATSGTITLQPVTGALGTVTLSLPAVTDTLAGLAATQTFSNKTLASPTVTGNIAAEATTRLIFGSNDYRYTNGTGPVFYDDTTGNSLIFNVQSLSGNRTITWPNTTLTVAGIDVANAWADGVKQTFNPDATNAGINVGSVAGDPSTPANGDLWYDSTANELTARINGANVALGSGGGGGITIGTTTITSGTNTRVLYNNSGVVGEYVITGTGNVMMSGSPTTTGRLTGADANFATAVTTGTGSTAGFEITANSLTTGNGHEISSSSVSSGNVVSIAATGTAAASNTKTALSVSTSGANATSTQTTYGARISNTSTGTTSTNVALQLTASGAATANQALNVSAGQIVTPNGSNSAPSYSFSGATNSGMFVANTNQPYFSSNGTTVAGLSTTELFLASGLRINFGSASYLRAGTASFILGLADAASPVAQTLSVQNVVGGTSNTAGANWTINASRGTGTGAGGDIIFQTAPAGGSGTTQNTLAAAFTVKGDGAVLLKSVTFANLPSVANGYLIYCSDCTLASPCASGGSGALAKGINGQWVCN